MNVVVRYPGKTEEKFRATRTLTNPDDTRCFSFKYLSLSTLYDDYILILTYYHICNIL